MSKTWFTWCGTGRSTTRTRFCTDGCPVSGCPTFGVAQAEKTAEFLAARDITYLV